MKMSYALQQVVAIALAATLLPALPVRAQSYPNQPVRLVLAVPPGSAVDTMGRLVAQYVSPNLGQPVIIDNKPGGSIKIASDFVSRSTPDGQKLLLMGSAQAQVEAAAVSTGQPRPFDTLREFISVGTLVTNTYALVVHPSLPVKTAREFVKKSLHPLGLSAWARTPKEMTDFVRKELALYTKLFKDIGLKFE